jgi:hypothetical protein
MWSHRERLLGAVCNSRVLLFYCLNVLYFATTTCCTARMAALLFPPVLSLECTLLLKLEKLQLNQLLRLEQIASGWSLFRARP